MPKINWKKKIALSLKSPRTAVNVLSDKLLGVEKNRYPRVIDLFVTEACNFACPMCHVKETRIKNGEAGGLDFESVKKIVAESKKYKPSFQLIGGEPTLYKNILETVRLIARNGMISGLTTNGLLLENYAENLIKNGLNFLAVSLDGWDEESQKKRGNVPGSFEKIIRGLQKAIKIKNGKTFPIIRVATVITKNNFRDLEKIGKVLLGLGIDTWSVSQYYFVTDKILEAQKDFLENYGIGEDVWGDRTGENPYFSPAEAEVVGETLKKIKKFSPRLNIDCDWSLNPGKFYSERFPGFHSRCLAPYKELFVRGNGDLELCQGYKLGNISDVSVKEAWNGQRAAHFRKVFKEKKLMPGCFRCCALDIKFN